MREHNKAPCLSTEPIITLMTLQFAYICNAYNIECMHHDYTFIFFFCLP